MAGAEPAAAPEPPQAANANPLTRARMERLAARAVAGFSCVFGLQVIPVILTQSPHLDAVYTIVVAVVLLASLAWLAVASGIGRTVRTAGLVFCVGFLLAVAFWHEGISDSGYFDGERPWLWYLLTVSTACAALVMPFALAAAYTVAAPVLYGVALATTAGSGALKTAVLDALYAAIFASVLLAIMTMLRQAATQVDARQAAALSRYEIAVRAHALEAERVEVDAIVHDSVLTTLLSAASARTQRAMSIAASMATDALGHLDTSAPLARPGRTLDEIAASRLRDRIVSAARSLTVPFSIVPRSRTDTRIPVGVAEALYSATVQAMVNSVQHAGGMLVRRSLSVEATDDGGVLIVVADDGNGFDPESVPPERLGLEVSIRERVALAGGEAYIESSPSKGTSVRLRWHPPDVAEKGEQE